MEEKKEEAKVKAKQEATPMTVSIADVDYTPNPDRAVWIEGEINQSLEDRLRPQILELISSSRAPITVYIDSPGGKAAAAYRILNLLRSTAEGDAVSCRIITVALSKAFSVAADLLSAGDFAMAHPHSRLLFHGTRIHSQEPVTAKSASMLADDLKSSNHAFAYSLLEKSGERLTFIFKAFRSSFAEHRAIASDRTLSDLQCFEAILRGKLSPAAQKVLELAITLWDNHNGLLLEFENKLKRVRGRTVTKPYLQKLMHHAAISFDYESNQEWDGELSRISDHFFFLNSYFDFDILCDWVAARAEPQMAGTDVESDYFLQFRVFFLALCRALQEGENELTPSDAVWLGLVDTVRSGYPSAVGLLAENPRS